MQNLGGQTKKYYGIFRSVLFLFVKGQEFSYVQGFLKDFPCHVISHVTSASYNLTHEANILYCLGIVDKGIRKRANKCHALFSLVFTLTK